MTNENPGGKLLYIQLHMQVGDGNWPQLLADPQPVEHMGVRCIRGTFRATADSHFLVGQTVYVPVDKILFMAEYESWDAYRDTVKRHYDAKAR